MSGRGSKAALCDLDGNILASRFAPYDTSYPRENWAEQTPTTGGRPSPGRPARCWRRHRSAPEKVAGVVYSTQMIGVLPVDAEGLRFVQR